MDESEKKSALKSRSLAKRLIASLSGFAIFAVMAYFAADFARYAVSNTRVPLWLRLPFFLFSGLTLFVGVRVLLPLFNKRQAARGTPPSNGVASADNIRFQSDESPATPIFPKAVSLGIEATFSLILLFCSLDIFVLSLRFATRMTTLGLTVYCLLGSVLLALSLVFPFKAIRRRLRSGSFMR
jgi:hypothetical protein